MAEMGLTTYRLSISWSRVQPDGRGRANPDGSGVLRPADRGAPGPRDHAQRDAVPLGPAPGAGGHRRVPQPGHGQLVRRLRRVDGPSLRRPSDDVGTFNEPWCYAYLGHAAGVHAPGLKDPRAAVTVAHHELLAHGLALQAMRAQRDGLELGIVINPSNIVSEGRPERARRPAAPDRCDPQPVVVRRAVAGRVPGRSPRRLRSVGRSGAVRRPRRDQPAARLARGQLLLRHPDARAAAGRAATGRGGVPDGRRGHGGGRSVRAHRHGVAADARGLHRTADPPARRLPQPAAAVHHGERLPPTRTRSSRVESATTDGSTSSIGTCAVSTTP